MVTPQKEEGKTVPKGPGDAALTKSEELGSSWELWQRSASQIPGSGETILRAKFTSRTWEDKAQKSGLQGA